MRLAGLVGVAHFLLLRLPSTTRWKGPQRGTRQLCLHLVHASQERLYAARLLAWSFHVAVMGMHDGPEGGLLGVHLNDGLARRPSLGVVDDLHALVDDRARVLSQELDDGLGQGVFRDSS